MRFDELASRAGKTAAEIGRRVERPSFSVVRRGRFRQTLFAGVAAAAAVVVLGFGAVLLWPESGDLAPAVSAATTTITEQEEEAAVDAREACPLTMPGNTPFTPAAQAPEGPPELYDSVWYGTPSLWTMVGHAGQVWSDLPVGEEGNLTQKTFWWAEGYVFDEEPAPQITVTAEHIDGSGPTVKAGGPGTNGTHPDLGSFMLVGLELPQEGCWKISAEYKDATLSYVVWVGDESTPTG
jgi:hypothetical protein